MSQKTNPLGGKNPNSLYAPITETEQEVLQRLVESDALEVHVLEWGVANKPEITFGDLRVSIKFTINFDKPEFFMPVAYLDLELRTRAGQLVFGPRRYPTVTAGETLMVKAGMFLDYSWDIAIQEMDPDFVKSIKPGASGLTTRRGNMNLSFEEQRLLGIADEGAKRVRDLNEQEALEATKKSEGQ